MKTSNFLMNPYKFLEAKEISLKLEHLLAKSNNFLGI